MTGQRRNLRPAPGRRRPSRAAAPDPPLSAATYLRRVTHLPYPRTPSIHGEIQVAPAMPITVYTPDSQTRLGSADRSICVYEAQGECVSRAASASTK